MKSEIRPINQEDYFMFFELINSNRARLKKYFPNTTKEIKTLEDSKKHLVESDKSRNAQEKYSFGIYMEEKLIGYINVKNIDIETSKCELGYFISEKHEGKGIMTEQIRNIIKYCFETLGLLKIFLRIGEENIGSKVIAEKTGFEKEGVLRKEFKLDNGDFIDIEYYGILNQNYIYSLEKNDF